MNVAIKSPILYLLYGLPGAGKSAFARQSAQDLRAIHINCDRVRYELYDDPRYTASENNTVLRIGAYMCEEALRYGANVLFDMHLPTKKLRDDMRVLASDHSANTLIIWVQTDNETARYRSMHRDRRRLDDRYTPTMSLQLYESIARTSVPSDKETYAVVSGKHLYSRQIEAVKKRLAMLGLIDLPAHNISRVNGGRVDELRRRPDRSL